MKILLIQASGYRENGRLDRRKSRWLLGMTLPYVAALTPSDIQVEIKDDMLEEITFREDCDLVGLTFMSHQAPRAFQLAAGFRRRGIPVVMGGFHATLAPEECQAHADALVIGEAEEAWPRLLRDFQAGRLQPRYQAEKLSDLKNLPVPRYDLLDLKRYKVWNIPSQTTRGCPYNCSFCEVTQVYGGKFRHRPVDEVIHEIQEIRRLTDSGFIYFVDDNFVANRRHALEIMERLIPLKLDYACLATANVGDDPEVLDLLARSGCRHVNIGMESISPESLKAINKKQNKIKDYERQFKALRDRGVGFSINVMFGLDGDPRRSSRPRWISSTASRPRPRSCSSWPPAPAPRCRSNYSRPGASLTTTGATTAAFRWFTTPST